MRKKTREPEPWGGRPGASFGPGRTGYADGPPAVLPSYARGPDAGTPIVTVTPPRAPARPLGPPLEVLPLSAASLATLRSTMLPLLAASAILPVGAVLVLVVAGLVAAPVLGTVFVLVGAFEALAFLIAAGIAAVQLARAATALGRIAAGEGVAQAHLVVAFSRLASALTVRLVLLLVAPPLACAALLVGYVATLFWAIGHLHG